MKITGTATYEAVTIEPKGDSIHITGEYMGDTTTYDAPTVFVHNMRVDPETTGKIRLERDSEEEWIMADAREHELHIYTE